MLGYTGVNEYAIITLDDNQINVTSTGQVALYSDYRPSFGRFSIFPIKDFDYDFYSKLYSQMGELEYEEDQYNQTDASGSFTCISANPEVREFYRDGGFTRLIGLLR